jgi:hypothetical protein
MLVDMWPEERPKYLATAQIPAEQEESEQDDNGETNAVPDTLPREREMDGEGNTNVQSGPKKFKERKDNRDDKIHEASLLRLPVTEPEDYWEKVPLKREPVSASSH